MARKASKKRTVHLTNRAVRDITRIESYSLEKFGKRVAAQYIDKLEAGVVRVSDNAELLREESLFHETLKFYRIEQHLLVCETGIEDKIRHFEVIVTHCHANAKQHPRNSKNNTKNEKLSCNALH